MTFAQRRNRLTTHFSECIPVVKRRMSVSLTVSGGGVSTTAVGPGVADRMGEAQIGNV